MINNADLERSLENLNSMYLNIKINVTGNLIISNNFLIQCKQNYFEGITPSNTLNRSKEGYKKIVLYAQEYFNKNNYNEFAGYLMEGQYFIALWAAHLLLEYGEPNEDLTRIAIKTIIRYSDNPLAPNVAEEERLWLNSNMENYKKFVE